MLRKNALAFQALSRRAYRISLTICGGFSPCLKGNTYLKWENQINNDRRLNRQS